MAMVGGGSRHDRLERLMEQVARGERDLASIKHPVEREAVRIALRLHADEPLVPDNATRARMRGRVLHSLHPHSATISDRIALVFEMLARPTPYLVRAVAAVVVVASLAAGATVASADSLPDDPLYGVKVAAEQIRLALATTSEDRASVELSIAEHRLAEAERLAGAGRPDDALVASGDYSAHVARAAAELAQLDTDPESALAAQLGTRFAEHRAHALSVAKKLGDDPATASGGQVLATVATPTLASGTTQAERIAVTAANVAQGLAQVAGTRAQPAAPSTDDQSASNAGGTKVTESVKKSADDARKAADDAKSAKGDNKSGKSDKGDKTGGDHKGAPKK